MITHYGLFWSEADVHWNQTVRSGTALQGRIKGQLGRQGAPTREEREESEDFGQYVGLYALYNDDELIYVGKAGLGNGSCLFDRLKQHRNDLLAGRWSKFSWFGRKKIKGKSRIETNLSQMEAV